MEWSGTLFQLVIGTLGLSFFIRVYKVLSQPLKHVFRANKRVKRLVSPLRAKELPGSSFGVFVNVIHYITVRVKVVVVVVKLAFHQVTPLLKGGICSVIQFVRVINLVGQTGEVMLAPIRTQGIVIRRGPRGWSPLVEMRAFSGVGLGVLS